jgi:hypothetical protein
MRVLISGVVAGLAIAGVVIAAMWPSPPARTR